MTISTSATLGLQPRYCIWEFPVGNGAVKQGLSKHQPLWAVLFDHT